MPPVFDECCVLIPASTLEDFPAKLTDADARSLLAAWTVLWHPRLLARTEQTPAWYRADSPPEPIGRRILVVPSPSLPKIPTGYQARAVADDQCHWITGGSRDEMIAALGLEPCQPLSKPAADGQGPASEGQLPARQIGIEDFFAAGFASLQIQIMTRRLRYTSNLDEIHLQTRIVDAAKAFLDGDADSATAALHDVFDALAEERDHYFTSDPHLIDLTLVTQSTIPRLVEEWSRCQDKYAPLENLESGVRPTPSSLLLDDGAVAELARSNDAAAVQLREQLRDLKIGWASGGPNSDYHLDAMTLVQAQDAFKSAHRAVVDAIGIAPPVYGRLSGSTPSDMTATIAGLGYVGMIPIDFTGGTGFGNESKVILQAGGSEIEALTAKPIDAASDVSFLAIGAMLGEAIDSGEVATALLVHWPGQGCDSFHDLRRIGSWSVSLGRFWKLDRYFVDGEHPYHHGTGSATSPDSGNLLTDLVARGVADPLTSIASEFRVGVVAERDAMLNAMTDLVSGEVGEHANAPESFAAAISSRVEAKGGSKSAARLLVNPHSIGVRDSALLASKVASADHVYGASSVSGGTLVTADVPAFGFVMIRPARGGDHAGKSSIRSWVRNKWLGNPTSIAQGGRLQNEFLEATIQPESGGISSVYSGSTRGNRFSMRLVALGMNADDKVRPDAKSETRMVCDKVRVIESSMAIGVIETIGRVTDTNDKTLATFKLKYSLRRGSRTINLDGDVIPTVPIGDDPWQSYVGLRAAVSSDASICRVLIRDKVHRAGSRRLVSPLGLVIDEAERQTMIGTSGLAFHRRVDERFFDTIIRVKGETSGVFSVHYGFDVTNPIATAKSIIAPPVQVAIDDTEKSNPIGWILHCAPKDVSIGAFDVFRRDDGSLAAMVRVVQTRPTPCTATLRFFRNVKTAFVANARDDIGADPLKSSGDQVRVSMAAHAVVDVLVVFE